MAGEQQVQIQTGPHSCEQCILHDFLIMVCLRLVGWAAVLLKLEAIDPRFVVGANMFKEIWWSPSKNNT